MTTYPDLHDFFDRDLVLPIDGVDYVVEPPSVAEIIQLRLNFADPERQATAVDRLVWQAKMLGATIDPATATVTAEPGSIWEQMETDGVSGEEILKAGEAALLRFGINPDLSEFTWTGGAKSAEAGDAEGKGPGSNRKQRRAAPKKKTPAKRSSKGATGRSTPAPAH